jgi:hypothetical protein
LEVSGQGLAEHWRKFYHANWRRNSAIAIMIFYMSTTIEYSR